MHESVEGVAWEDLNLLIAAAECGSLSRAAETLRIGQSTASRRLTRLERVLGSPLFDRTPEGLLPTDLALQLLPHARSVEAEMAQIERVAGAQQSEPEGRVRLAVPNGMASGWLMDVLGDFFERYPKVDLDIVSGNAVLDLMRREADLALRFVRPTAGDLVVRTVGRLDFAPYARPELAERAPEEIRWLALADPGGRFPETQWIQRWIAPRHLLAVSSWSALLAGARAGLGAAILTPKIAESIGLVRVAPELQTIEARPLYLVYHRSLRAVPRIAALREWLAEMVLQTFDQDPENER